MSVSAEILTGAKITVGPQAWQVLQREADGRAPVFLEGVWAANEECTVEVRVASEDFNQPVAGCDWQQAEMLPEQRWRMTLRIPTGGLYRIETRARRVKNGERLNGDRIWHIAVGDLWIIAGQSNASGFGHGPVYDPPLFNLSVFGGNEVWRLATHPLFDPTDTKHPANRDEGWIDCSPWMAFGRVIVQQAGVPVGLIPTALGGSMLSAWDPEEPADGVLYNNMVSMVDAAGGRVAGIVWYQGCSDATEDRAPSYQERFGHFVSAVRARYGERLPIITAQLNRVLNYGPESVRPWSVIRDTQRQAPGVFPHLAVVPTLDAPLSDGIHNSAAGCVLIGERFGLAALGMVYGQDVPWKAADIREVRFTDAARDAIRLSFDDVAGELWFLCMPPKDFMVIDADGEIAVTDAVSVSGDTFELKLARPARGETVCHNGYGCDPACTLRDHLQRPALAFYQIPVWEA